MDDSVLYDHGGDIPGLDLGNHGLEARPVEIGVARDRSRLKIKDIPAIEKNIFDLSVKDLENFDVVIDAFGSEKGKEIEHETSMNLLISIFDQLPETRLFVVGGAGSLYTDETQTVLLMDTNSPVNPIAFHMSNAFRKLKNSNVNWTYLSPAQRFDPLGKKNGTYKLGTDWLIKNEAGESYVSYSDYAIALVDEIKNKKFVKERYTVVSENLK